MKLIIMGGLPKSGKTTIVQKSINNDTLHICRENVHVDDPLEQWNTSINLLYDAITKDMNVIFDSCGVNIKQLMESVTIARIRGYEIRYIFIDREIEKCAEHIDMGIINKYRNRVIDALKSIKDNNIELLIINNNNSIDDALGQIGDAI